MLAPDSAARWGTMTCAEMLSHMGDSQDSALKIRVDPNRTVASGPLARFVKWFALSSPFPWPKGKIKGPQWSDPRRGGSKPAEFDRDRERVIRGLRALADAAPDALAAGHPVFGAMSLGDYHVWAYRHLDHHLRQFGL